MCSGEQGIVVVCAEGEGITALSARPVKWPSASAVERALHFVHVAHISDCKSCR